MDPNQMMMMQMMMQQQQAQAAQTAALAANSVSLYDCNAILIMTNVDHEVSKFCYTN
jgi:hypothetical protein